MCIRRIGLETYLKVSREASIVGTHTPHLTLVSLLEENIEKKSWVNDDKKYDDI